jgi:hypothetical protein
MMFPWWGWLIAALCVGIPVFLLINLEWDAHCKGSDSWLFGKARPIPDWEKR